jgi:hypothetical protein
MAIFEKNRSPIGTTLWVIFLFLALLNDTVDIYTFRLWRTLSASKVQAASLATLK